MSKKEDVTEKEPVEKAEKPAKPTSEANAKKEVSVQDSKTGKYNGEANADKPKQKSGDDDAAFAGLVNSVRRQLMAEEKRRILIPLMPGEPKNTYQPFNVNGYRVNVKKGVYVEVPATIASISEESFKQTEEAGTDLVSPNNGNPLRVDMAPQETQDALTFN